MRLAKIDPNHAIIPINVIDVQRASITKSIAREGAAAYEEVVPIVKIIMSEGHDIELEIISKEPDALDKVYAAVCDEIDCALIASIQT